MKWIASQESLNELASELEPASIVAFDTEADSLHSYYDKVCLIQISAGADDYVVDPLTKIDLTRLGEILSNPAVTKVFHGADYDLRILRRDFGFSVVNFVDTMVCAQLLGYESFGLSALLKQHFNVDADKSHQRADWSMRPLTSQMLAYATMDTHYLIELQAQLREKLEALGRWDWAVEEFGRMESIKFREAEEKEEGFRRIKGSNRLDRRGLAALSLLHDWRDGLARKSDRPPFKIIGNEAMLEISRALPTNIESLKSVKAVAPYHTSRFGREILSMMSKARGLDESELPARADSKGWVRDKNLERRLEKLKKVRDEVAESLKIEQSLLAPKHVLTSIAELDPKQLDDLDAVPSLRRWQKSVMGEQLVKALTEPAV
ncbi:MAG TPA: ribonuclease D [Thermoanaerobaculia bacterium]|nr:ribonuclease D [Thermoanaerobaculia bacterium]